MSRILKIIQRWPPPSLALSISSVPGTAFKSCIYPHCGEWAPRFWRALIAQPRLLPDVQHTKHVMFPLTLEFIISMWQDITPPACRSAQHTPLLHVYTVLGTEDCPIRGSVRSFCSIFPGSTDRANGTWTFRFSHWQSHLNCTKQPWSGMTTAFHCPICPKPRKEDLRTGPLHSQHVCSKYTGGWHIKRKHSPFS